MALSLQIKICYPSHKLLHELDYSDNKIVEILYEDDVTLPFEGYVMVYDGSLGDLDLDIDPSNMQELELLEEIFRLFNDDEKNPLSSSEKQQIIIDNGSHTSMSVGDIVQLGETMYKVGMFGFRVVPVEFSQK